MKSFKQILNEINDNPDPTDVVKEYVRLKNKSNRDEMEESKFIILSKHPAVTAVKRMKVDGN
jgi:hypothetical protein